MVILSLVRSRDVCGFRILQEPQFGVDEIQSEGWFGPIVWSSVHTGTEEPLRWAAPKYLLAGFLLEQDDASHGHGCLKRPTGLQVNAQYLFKRVCKCNTLHGSEGAQLGSQYCCE
jgi:hypothetical protein